MATQRQWRIGRILSNLLVLGLIMGFTNLGLMGEDSDLWVVYDGIEGPGKGKHIVLISGDEEYRSEEGLPQLAKILAKHHGFKCTVHFAIDPKDGTINPALVNNIPGLQALETADLMIIATRFRELPDTQMEYIVRYVDSGRPIIGMRTATHAFRYSKESHSKYRSYDFQSETWKEGFGRQVLGETWIAHHGQHGVESTRGIIVEGMKDHPIVRGCDDIWGPTDVYEVRLPMCDTCQPLVLGQVLSGMQPSDPPFVGKKVRKGGGTEFEVAPNDPMMPIAWIKKFKGEDGETSRIFTTTMGASEDLLSEGLRRLLVNATYWGVGMEDRIPERANVDLVGKYSPTGFGFNKYKVGLKPSDYALKP
ncbi:MAG TPA: hypothetical protein VMY18_09295 [Acidobacteriota bacterium]|nr:hypothetical protein [Acidobacteriota bacterium]